MDLKTPARAVIPTLDAEVLVALAGMNMPVTGRQLSRIIEAKGHRGVGLSLERLRLQGLVTAVKAGNANLYTLNREHVAAPAVEALVDLRGKLFGRMSAAIEGWPIPPVCVAVFGSAARGDGGVDSDIDALVVPPEEGSPHPDGAGSGASAFDQVAWDAQLSEFAQKVRIWSGNSASLIQATRSQLVSMVERQEPIVESLQKDARYLWGPRIMSTLSESS